MALFSHLWKHGKVESPAALVVELDKVAAVQGLKAGEMHRLFGKAQERISLVRSLCQSDEFPSLTNAEHSNQMHNPFQDIQREWLAVDRSNLTVEDAEFMYNVVLVWLPEVVSQYRERSSRFGVRRALKERFTSDVPILRNRSVGEAMRFAHAGLVSIRDRQWREDYVVEVPKPSFVVPRVSHKDGELFSVVSRLHGLWVAADGLQLSAEDKFFVGEVAGRYFPDAWRMLQSFGDDDLALRGEARTIFVEQVDLMCRRLEKLVVVKQQGSLSEMRAHASFLREVTA